MNNKLYLVEAPVRLNCVWVATDDARMPLVCVWVDAGTLSISP